MSFPARIILALACLLLICASLRAQETIEIKPRLLPGKRYFLTMRTDQASKSQVGEEKMDQRMITTIDLVETVSAAQSGQPKRMTVRYVHVTAEMDVNDQKMTYDSANPKASTDPMDFAKTYGSMVGQDLKVTLNENDEVESIENYDDFKKRLTAGSDPDPEAEKTFSREALTQMMRQGGLQAVPDKAIAVGDSWPFRSTIELPELGKITVSGNYTLQSIGDHNGARCAEVVADGTLTLDVSDPAPGASPDEAQTVKVTGGKIKGPIWFDLQLGTERDSQLVEEMTISIKDPSDPTVSVIMPSKTSVTTTLTKVEDVK
jgi:hypothetical protein